jgi:hypothetical protein
MKVVGNQPACTLRRAGDGRAAPAHAHSAPAQPTHQPAGEPGEPITPAQIKKTKPLDFGPIGWSFREAATSYHRDWDAFRSRRADPQSGGAPPGNIADDGSPHPAVP